ncbi:MAG: FAD-dependent oxidoreductase [Acidobacteriota bacterium]
MRKACRVGVIGAGPSGLVTTKTLAGAGLDVTCLEMSSGIGGHWLYDNPNGRSSAYRSLQTNTTPSMSRLSDYEMPPDGPDFASHEQIHAWFDAYIDRFGFRDRILHERRVTAARPLPAGGWEVEARRGERETEVHRLDALVACTGSYWSPRIPSVPGDFDGVQLHAQGYRDPDNPVPTAGQRVIVVGLGNTACEIASELGSSHAEAVFLSSRGGTWIMPKTRNGEAIARNVPMTSPFDEPPTWVRMVPSRWRQSLFARMAKARMSQMFGEQQRRLQAAGLPEPPEHPLEKRPTVCDPILDALESGRVEARPQIERFDGRRVVFVDGSSTEADLVVWGTGYRLTYPYLPKELLAPGDENPDMFLGTMHPERHDLFLVGVGRPTGAFWPSAEVQAQFVAALLSGAYALPKARTLRRRIAPMLPKLAYNPALFALSMREELRRGARRARRQKG